MPRTRSASAHRKVLDAAIHLIAEHGVDATSVDAIAQKSGVSKATIYKHWEDKDALLLEVLAEVHGLHSRPVFDTTDTRAGLLAVLSYAPPDHTGLRDRITPHLLGYSARNQAFGAAWRKRVMEPPRKDLTRLIELGVARKQLPPKLDVELALALLFGPMIYSHVFLRRGRDEAKHLAEGVVDAFWKAFARPRLTVPRQSKLRPATSRP